MGNVHSHHKPTEKEEAWICIIIGVLSIIGSSIMLFLCAGIISTALFSERSDHSFSTITISIGGAVFLFGYPFILCVHAAYEQFKEGIDKFKALRKKSKEE